MDADRNEPISNLVKPGPRYVFLHLLAMAALYTSAVSFLVLIFQYINLAFPDILEGERYYRSGAYGLIRGSIASLIIVFPVYIWATWYLNKRYFASQELAQSKSRKWLVYFTIFIAALIIIGDLISLVYNLLEGELTARFLLKVLAVFFVAASVFTYYFWDLKRHKVE